jgi:aspartate/methionine/tyrosine aminotransferase
MTTTPAQIIVTAGVTNTIEVTAWSLGDPGDGVLLGRPFYSLRR